MSGTRREILDLLLRRELSAHELAAELGLSSAAVRQHLSTLRGAGLVVRRKGEPRPGRPRYLYALSPQARRAFPKRYDVLASGLYEVLVDRHGEDAALEHVAAAARRLARRARERTTSGGSGARWDVVLAWLEETFALEAEWEPLAGGGRRLVTHQCPFQDVTAQALVCGTFFTALVGELLGTKSARHVPFDGRLRCCAIEIERADPPAEA